MFVREDSDMKNFGMVCREGVSPAVDTILLEKT
jgi:hypothetical protein